MPLTVRYDDESDILTVWTGEDIATSSSATKYRGLVVDFGNEDGFDVVGFELMGAAKLLAPFLEKMLQKSATNRGSPLRRVSMPKLIDLTITLGSDRITVVPGLIGVTTEPLQTHETHTRSNTKLTLATHLGTHVDAPYHFDPNGETLENMPLERYMGPALLLDLRQVAKSKTPLSVDELREAGAAADDVKDRIVVLFTDWAHQESGNQRFYSDGPYLSTEGADYLAQHRVNAVAVDFPIDKHPPTPQSTMSDFPVHRLLLGQGIPIIENLINLDQLVGHPFELWALPIKLKGGDGGAARAVARLI